MGGWLVCVYFWEDQGVHLLYLVLSHPGISIEIKSSDTVVRFVFKLLLKLNVSFAGAQNLNIQGMSYSFKRCYQAEAKYVYKILIKFRKISEVEMTLL